MRQATGNRNYKDDKMGRDPIGEGGFAAEEMKFGIICTTLIGNTPGRESGHEEDDYDAERKRQGRS